MGLSNLSQKIDGFGLTQRTRANVTTAQEENNTFKYYEKGEEVWKFFFR